MTDTGPGCVRVVVDRSAVELVADRLWFAGATAIGEWPVDGGVELEAGFGTQPEAEVVAARLRADGFDAEAIDAGPALDIAVDAWRSFARPVRVGRLHVRPSWLAGDDDPPAAGERVVVLDPTRAFGAGDHASTMAGLAAVDRWAADGVAVLDVGCGSGVLAVAAAVLGAGPVVAVDVDPVAVAATEANAAANGVEVDVSLGSAGDVDGRFDLVLANVGAGTVIGMAVTLAARTAPGGRLVTAGFYADRAGEVSGALCAVGLAEVGRSIDGGWASLIHQSPSSVKHTVRASHR